MNYLINWYAHKVSPCPYCSFPPENQLNLYMEKIENSARQTPTTRPVLSTLLKGGAVLWSSGAL